MVEKAWSVRSPSSGAGAAAWLRNSQPRIRALRIRAKVVRARMSASPDGAILYTAVIPLSRPQDAATGTLQGTRVISCAALIMASMFLIGRLNWWMPGWLDRIMPRPEAESHTAAQSAAVGAAR